MELVAKKLFSILQDTFIVDQLPFSGVYFSTAPRGNKEKLKAKVK